MRARQKRKIIEISNQYTRESWVESNTAFEFKVAAGRQANTQYSFILHELCIYKIHFSQSIDNAFFWYENYYGYDFKCLISQINTFAIFSFEEVPI